VVARPAQAPFLAPRLEHSNRSGPYRPIMRRLPAW
jgi:hypothetical protein